MTKHLQHTLLDAEDVAGPASSPATQPEPAPAHQPATAAEDTHPKKRSISRAAWLALVIGVVVLVFMLVFILQNNRPAQFTLLAWSFTTPMGVAMLFAAIAGALITAMVGTVRMIVLGRDVRKLERERERATRV